MYVYMYIHTCMCSNGGSSLLVIHKIDKEASYDHRKAIYMCLFYRHVLSVRNTRIALYEKKELALQFIIQF